MNISIVAACSGVDPEEIKKAIRGVLDGRADGPWELWLGPHEVEATAWRLRVSCPGYSTGITIPATDQTPQGVARHLRQILSLPVSCLEPTA